MENRELIEGPLGSKGKYDLEIKDNCLVAEISYVDTLVGVGASVKLPAAAVLDALAKAIPGTLDDKIIAAAKKALGL